MMNIVNSDIKTGARYKKIYIKNFIGVFYATFSPVDASSNLNQSSRSRFICRLRFKTLMVSAFEVPITGRIFAGCLNKKDNRIWFSAASYFGQSPSKTFLILRFCSVTSLK